MTTQSPPPIFAYSYVLYIAIPTTFTFQLTLSINFYELNTYAESIWH